MRRVRCADDKIVGQRAVGGERLDRELQRRLTDLRDRAVVHPDQHAPLDVLDGDLVLGSSAHGHRGHSAHGRLEIVLGQGCHSAYNWRAVVGALLLFDAQLRVEPLGDHLDGVDHARVLHVVRVGRFTSEPLMRYEDNVIVAVRQIVKRIAIDELSRCRELLAGS